MKKIIITGNVGKDPEIKADQMGTTHTHFQLAVKVGTKDKPKTDWVNVVVSGKLQEVTQKYVVSGMKLLVEGFPVAHAYINKENKAIAILQVYAHNIEFISGGKDQSSSSNLKSDNIDF